MWILYGKVRNHAKETHLALESQNWHSFRKKQTFYLGTKDFENVLEKKKKEKQTLYLGTN